MLEYCLENGNEMAISPYKKNWKPFEAPQIEKVFGWGHVIQKEQLPDGRSNIILEGMGTAEIIEFNSTEPFIIATVKKIEQDRSQKSNPQYQLSIDEILLLTKRILLSEGADESLILKMNHIKNHFYPVDFIASMLNYDYEQKQDILSTTNAMDKAIKLLNIVRSLNLKE